MARLPLIDPATAEPRAAELLRSIAGERGQPFNVYRMLANSPAMLERVYALASELWSGALQKRMLELVILRVAQLTQSDYEWARHRAIARRVGVGDEQVDALLRWREQQHLYDAATCAALALAEEVTLGIEARPQTVALAHAELGDRATLELVLLIGFYGMIARLLRSLAVDAEPGDEPAPRGVRLTDIYPIF